jgi:hypothetical protein
MVAIGEVPHLTAHQQGCGRLLLDHRCSAGAMRRVGWWRSVGAQIGQVTSLGEWKDVLLAKLVNHLRPAALRIASVSVNQTLSSFFKRERTRRIAAAPSGVPITNGWIPMTTVVAPRAGSARASLARGFVHEIWTAARKVRAEDRTLAESEFLDEKRKAHRDFSVVWPGADVDGITRESVTQSVPSCANAAQGR